MIPTNECSWCAAERGEETENRGGICRKHMLLSIYQASPKVLSPKEYDELWDLLEPRAAACADYATIFTWCLIGCACIMFWWAVSSWAMRGFSIVREVL